MKQSLITTISLMFVLQGCSSSDDVCEDVTLASEQIHQCQILQRQIVNAKGQPLIRTELERRYQQDCIDVRYYRDEKQQAICGNKHKSEEIKNKMSSEASKI